MFFALTATILSVRSIRISSTAYLMLATGGGALLLAVVIRSLWRSRKLDLSWMVVLIASFSVLLASGLFKLEPLRADKLAPDQAQVRQRGGRGASKETFNARTPQRSGRERASAVTTRSASRLNLVLLAQIGMLLYVGGALKFCAHFIPGRQNSDRESARLAEAEAIHPLKLLAIAAELGLLILILRLYNLESTALADKLMPIVFCGFLLNDLMPLRWRPLFFVLLSFAGAYVIFGWASTLLLIGMGLLLLSVLYLPFRFSARLTILLAIGIALFAARFYWANADLVGVIWPILGSMFMFRLISYTHYVKHHNPEPDIPFALAYFFLLPNLTFPLFPIVDYATFRRTYYESDKYSGYQTGMHWIARGVTHLLAYRLIYHYLLIGPGEVISFWSLLRYLVSNFLLILRASGQFHIAIGILRLFGFNLPEVMRRFFLASSFSEFWRRANTYWKDFMQKIVFFPTYFRLRTYGSGSRVIIGILVVFVITALLHSYQWFWLRGSVVASWTDLLFWTAFGVLVAVSALREEKQSAANPARPSNSGWSRAAATALCTGGTFMVVAILWSLWISNSLSEWLRLWTVLGRGLTKIDSPSLVCGALVLAFAGFSAIEQHVQNPVKSSRVPPFAPSSAIIGVMLLCVYVVGLPSTYTRFNTKLVAAFRHMQKDELNAEDAALLQRGYYENLTRIDRFNPRLWGLYMQRRENAPSLQEAGVLQRHPGSFLGHELRPGAAAVFKGAPLHVNRWGMRDKDYDEKKSANTRRIALLGASPEMGSGVGDDETFEWVLEDRLNLEAIKPNRYEILNFAGPGYNPLQRLVLMEERAFRFDPDVVFYVAHSADRNGFTRMRQLRPGPVEAPFPEVRAIEKRARAVRLTGPDLQQAVLAAADEIMAWTYRRLVDDCRERNILPVYIFLPTSKSMAGRLPKRAEDDLRMAREAGFEIIDLSDVYAGEDERVLRVSEWDFHPSAYGHRLIANRLYQEVRANAQLRQRLGL